MTDYNFTDDMLDVRDLIARFEELEEMRTPWTVGANMPGYMPDNTPDACQTWEDARDALIETIERDTEAQDETEEADTLQNEGSAAIEELKSLKEGAEFGRTVGTLHYWLTASADSGLDEDDAKEFALLEELLEELKGAGGDEQWRGDWYPISLIADSHFTDYARELLEDCGDLPKNLPHYIAIDWEETAKNIRADYSSVDVDGNSFWYR